MSLPWPIFALASTLVIIGHESDQSHKKDGGATVTQCSVLECGVTFPTRFASELPSTPWTNWCCFGEDSAHVQFHARWISLSEGHCHSSVQTPEYSGILLERNRGLLEGVATSGRISWRETRSSIGILTWKNKEQLDKDRDQDSDQKPEEGLGKELDKKLHEEINEKSDEKSSEKPDENKPAYTIVVLTDLPTSSPICVHDDARLMSELDLQFCHNWPGLSAYQFALGQLIKQWHKDWKQVLKALNPKVLFDSCRRTEFVESWAHKASGP
jgi:hypothetical protein